MSDSSLVPENQPTKLKRRVRNAMMALLRRFVARQAGPDALNGVDFNQSKVLFLRQNMIGDALVSTPVFAALRERYPDMTLDVLVDRRNAAVFEHDHIIRNRWNIKKKPVEIIRLLKSIRAERYDIVVDMIHSASATSTIVCWLGNAKVTVGPSRLNDYIYDVTVNHADSAACNTRMMRRIAEVLTVFDIDPDATRLKPYYNLPDSANDFAVDMAARLRGPSSNRRLIGFNISGSKAEKFWGTEQFTALARYVETRYPDAAVVILYSRDYESHAREIAADTCAELSGTTRTLPDFAACISNLDVLVSTDSSAVHFADIHGVPVVDLVLDPEPNTLWLPSNSAFRAVRALDHDINTITVDAVAQALDSLIAEIDEPDKLMITARS